MVYHSTEFVYVLFCHTTELSSFSFFFFPTNIFAICVILPYIEFFLELWYFPGLKIPLSSYLLAFKSIMGLAATLFRVSALFTAKSNFYHFIRTEKEEGHTLVDTGAYAFERHPSYTGFFYSVVIG